MVRHINKQEKKKLNMQLFLFELQSEIFFYLYLSLKIFGIFTNIQEISSFIPQNYFFTPFCLFTDVLATI